jgi:hypothetical protein
MTAQHRNCIAPLLLHVGLALVFCAAAMEPAGREPLERAAAPRSGESDLARLGAGAAPSRRTFSSAAANGSRPFCVRLLANGLHDDTLPSCAVGDVAADDAAGRCRRGGSFRGMSTPPRNISSAKADTSLAHARGAAQSLSSKFLASAANSKPPPSSSWWGSP